MENRCVIDIEAFKTLTQVDQEFIIQELRMAGGNLFSTFTYEDRGKAAQGRLLLLNGEHYLSDIFIIYLAEMPLREWEVPQRVVPRVETRSR